MEVETKYVARQPGAFAALMEAPEVAGFHLEPMPSLSVVDHYLDTPGGDLLRQGYAFRAREGERGVLATLKSLAVPEGALHRRRELEAMLDAPLGDGAAAPALPEGALREAVEWLAGTAAPGVLLRLRQYRAPRVVYDGGRLVGVLSLDVVAYEAGEALHVENEVEVELAEDGREADLLRLDPVLRARGLEPAPRSKFERAVLLLPHGPDDPLLLLPDERVALEAMQERGNPLHRRRARVILLAAKGYSTQTISNKAGLSPSRVRHWKGLFRDLRMGVFDEPAEREPAPGVPEPQPPLFRVSALVVGGAPTPALFGPETLGDDPFDESEIEPPQPEAPDDEPWGVDPGGDPFASTRRPSGWGPLPVGPSGDVAYEEPPAVTLAPLPLGGDGAVQPRRLPPPGPARPPRIREEEIEFERGPQADAGFPLEIEREVVRTAVEPRSTGDGANTPTLPRLHAPALLLPPRLRPEEPVVAAAERVLRHQTDRLGASLGRLRAEHDGAGVRRALLAAHRVRIALHLFADYAPSDERQRLHDALRPLARGLDRVADLDRAAGLSPAEDASVLATLVARREVALGGVLAHRAASAWEAPARALLDILQHRAGAALLAGPPVPDDYLTNVPVRPARTLVRHRLASALWERYETVRAYEGIVAEAGSAAADPDALRPLAGACAALHFVLGLAAGCGADSASFAADVRALSRRLDATEAALTALRDGRLAAEMRAAAAGDFGAGEALGATFSGAWEALLDAECRAALGRVTAAI